MMGLDFHREAEQHTMNNHCPYDTDEERWSAVAGKVKEAAGSFVYAVRTTGVFCRPGCSSRLPNRDNVEYFASAKDAEAAGYRPCKRWSAGRCCCRGCHGAEDDTGLQDHGYKQPGAHTGRIGRRVWCKRISFSPAFQKNMLALHQSNMLCEQRSRRFGSSLKRAGSVTEAIYEAGYSSSSGAYQTGCQQLAMTPKEYRAEGAGITIHYGVSECVFGWVIVGATDRGVCAVEFGDSGEEVVRQLRDRFAKAILKKADREFACVLKGVISHIQKPGKLINLPLDIRGTVFQQRVWKCAAPEFKSGQTMSYTEVAERIGCPKAVRAVASACGSQ